MCKTTLFRHKTCDHTWAVVSEPCGPGMGFSTCETFGSANVKELPPYYTTSARTCPRCGFGKGGDFHYGYDRNIVRMVMGMGNGLKWGTGPGADDWGCELKCVVL